LLFLGDVGVPRGLSLNDRDLYWLRWILSNGSVWSLAIRWVRRDWMYRLCWHGIRRNGWKWWKANRSGV